MSLFAFSVFAAPFGTAVGVILLGGVMLFQPSPPNPDEVYQAIYGSIQNQINTAINNKVCNTVMG